MGSHRDFDYNRIILGNDHTNNDAGVKDKAGHGTHIAGIIAAKSNNITGVTGINWNSKLYIIQTCNDNYPHSASNIGFINSVNEAIQSGAKIINCSFGLTTIDDQAVRNVIQNALNNNILIVASGGNGGNHYYPGDYSTSFDNVITVSAINSNDELISTSGSHICVAAPGYNVFSTFPDSTSNDDPLTLNYNYENGASQATAFISGVASLILSKEPNLAPQQTKRIIELSSDDIYPLGRDNNTGWGRINAYNALLITKAGNITSNEVYRNTITLTGNIFVSTGARLSILNNSIINLNGNYIKSNGGTFNDEGATW